MWSLVYSLFVCCFLGDRPSSVHKYVYIFVCVFVCLYPCCRVADNRRTVPGEGRKVVQEGCSCVNRSSVSSPPLSPCLQHWLEVHQVQVKDQTCEIILGEWHFYSVSLSVPTTYLTHFIFFTIMIHNNNCSQSLCCCCKVEVKKKKSKLWVGIVG